MDKTASTKDRHISILRVQCRDVQVGDIALLQGEMRRVVNVEIWHSTDEQQEFTMIEIEDERYVEGRSGFNWQCDYYIDIARIVQEG